jgi:hypothetical protein
MVYIKLPVLVCVIPVIVGAGAAREKEGRRSVAKSAKLTHFMC